MKKPRLHLPFLVATLACAMGWLSPSVASASTNLNPFAPRSGKSLSPFHMAQAEEEPDPFAEESKAKSAPAPQTEPAKKEIAPTPAVKNAPAKSETAADSPKLSAPAAASSAAKPAEKAALLCSVDEECPSGTICENGTCQTFERPIDILLYRKRGHSTAFIPFYWSKSGNSGHRVVAPLYWHFWSPEGRTQAVAPFYWRVEDYLKQRVVTVVFAGGIYVQTTQPDAKSWAFWPIFYKSTKFGWVAPPLLSFKIANPDQGKAYGLWFLLYYWSRTRTSKFDLLLPLAISSRSKESAFTYAIPLNFYWRRGEEKSLLSVPFFYQFKKPTGGLFASLLGYSSVEGSAHTGSYLWLYWFGRSQTSSYDILFPLLWSFRSPGANTTILPPLFHFRSRETTVGTFAMVGWWARNEKDGTNWQLAIPLYFRKSSDHGKKAFHMWPFGTYRRDDTAGSRHLTMLLPPILHWRDKTGELDYWLLYFHNHDIPTNSRTSVLGPYYHREDPAGSTRIVFPLFWHFRDAATGATAHSFLPFYFRRNSPTEKLTAIGVLPLLGAYYRSFSDGGSSGGLFPLAFFGSRKDRSHAIVFPLFWRFRKADVASTLFLPLYYASADKTSSNTFVFPLLYFAGSDSRESYRIQIPFYWNFVDGRNGTSTTVAPLYFRHQDKKGYAAGIWPLFFWGGGGQQRHFAFFPLFWWFRDDAQDRTTTVVANYLHRRHGQELTDAFFPLFHYRRGAKPGKADETSLTLFPLFHYRREPQATLFVSPLAAWKRSPEKQLGFVGPYFWYRDATVSTRGIPLLYLDHTQLDTGKRTRMWGNYLAIETPDSQARVFFPFWAHYKNPSEEGTYIAPLFYRVRKNDGYRLDTFFPLVWLSKSPDSHTTQILTYFSHHSPKGSSSGLLPFYYRSSSPDRNLLITPLFVSHTNQRTENRQVFSLLYYEAKQREKLLRIAFPLWWQTRDENSSSTVGFPLYWHFTNQKENKSTTVVGPLYWAQNGSERTRAFMALAWYSRDEKNGAASHALLPLFYERHSPRSMTLLTLPFGYHNTPDSRWHYVFPLWLHHRNKVTETSTLFVPPLLHYSRISPERSLSTFMLLFWNRNDITSSTTFGLPLFYDFHTYHQSRFTMLLPLFFRYENQTSGTSTTIAPLFFRHSSPTDSTTIALPLVWRFWSPERSTTVVFPFYVGVKRPTYDANYVFPNIYYRKGLGSDAGTSHLFVFPFWESEIKRPGDYMWEALLGLVGWERIGRNRFLKLLFIPFELEAAPAAKTAWYGKPPTRKHERVARGLDIKSW
jgi:hypothetical protein